jgi:hypothetical protein
LFLTILIFSTGLGVRLVDACVLPFKKNFTTFVCRHLNLLLEGKNHRGLLDQLLEFGEMEAKKAISVLQRTGESQV